MESVIYQVWGVYYIGVKGGGVSIRGTVVKGYVVCVVKGNLFEGQSSIFVV